jgi:hypothetical protein
MSSVPTHSKVRKKLTTHSEARKERKRERSIVSPEATREMKMQRMRARVGRARRRAF